MARLPRYFAEGLPLHIIQRGNNREPIFGRSPITAFIWTVCNVPPANTLRPSTPTHLQPCQKKGDRSRMFDKSSLTPFLRTSYMNSGIGSWKPVTRCSPPRAAGVPPAGSRTRRRDPQSPRRPAGNNPATATNAQFHACPFLRTHSPSSDSHSRSRQPLRLKVVPLDCAPVCGLTNPSLHRPPMALPAQACSTRSPTQKCAMCFSASALW